MKLQAIHSNEINNDIVDTDVNDNLNEYENMIGNAPTCNSCGYFVIHWGSCHRCLNCGYFQEIKV